MMNRNQDETFIEYCQRLTQALQNKEISYSEWGNAIAGNTTYGDESLRRASTVFSMFLKRLIDEGITDISDKEILNEIERKQKEVLKERKKLQTENLTYQANLRNDARSEMFNERILEAIECLPKFDISPFRSDKKNCGSTGVLCISDAHYGSDIELKSLFGEVVNVYNPDVFKARLRLLSTKIVKDYDKFRYSDLIIFDLGDAVENILRMSSLQKLQLGAIDASIEYAEIISNWIVGLRNELGIPIKYEACGGNHDIMRILSSKKDFPEENLMKVIVEMIKLRLKDCDGIEVANYGECQFETICGENILAYHGDYSKSEQDEIGFWENYQEVQIDILITGHFHNKSEKVVGYGCIGDKEVIHVPSLVGADTYSKQIRKLSRAGAKFILFEQDVGKSWEKIYHLN